MFLFPPAGRCTGPGRPRPVPKPLLRPRPRPRLRPAPPPPPLRKPPFILLALMMSSKLMSILFTILVWLSGCNTTIHWRRHGTSLPQCLARRCPNLCLIMPSCGPDGETLFHLTSWILLIVYYNISVKFPDISSLDLPLRNTWVLEVRYRQVPYQGFRTMESITNDIILLTYFHSVLSIRFT